MPYSRRPKGPGRGWHDEPRRHSLAGKGIKTVIPGEERRLAVHKFVAMGHSFLPEGVAMTIDKDEDMVLLEGKRGISMYFFTDKKDLRMPQTMKSFCTLLTKAGFSKLDVGKLKVYIKQQDEVDAIIVSDGTKIVYMGQAGFARYGEQVQFDVHDEVNFKYYPNPEIGGAFTLNYKGKRYDRVVAEEDLA